MTATHPDREPFARLRDPKRRREALELVRRAVAGAWPMPAAARAALVAELGALAESPALMARETLAVARILAAMTAANLRAARGACDPRSGRGTPASPGPPCPGPVPALGPADPAGVMGHF